MFYLEFLDKKKLSKNFLILLFSKIMNQNCLLNEKHTLLN